MTLFVSNTAVILVSNTAVILVSNTAVILVSNTAVILNLIQDLFPRLSRVYKRQK